MSDNRSVGLSHYLSSIVSIVATFCSFIEIVSISKETNCQPITLTVCSCIALIGGVSIIQWLIVHQMTKNQVEVLMSMAALIMISQIVGYITIQHECHERLTYMSKANIVSWFIITTLAMTWKFEQPEYSYTFTAQPMQSMYTPPRDMSSAADISL